MYPGIEREGSGSGLGSIYSEHLIADPSTNFTNPIDFFLHLGSILFVSWGGTFFVLGKIIMSSRRLDTGDTEGLVSWNDRPTWRGL